MVSHCANPECGADFLYLHDGEVFLIQLPDKTVECHWLCRSCAPNMHVVYMRSEGVKVVPRAGLLDLARSIGRAAMKKPAERELVYKGSSRKLLS
jgi:hypothetical protein